MGSTIAQHVYFKPLYTSELSSYKTALWNDQNLCGIRTKPWWQMIQVSIWNSMLLLHLFLYILICKSYTCVCVIGSIIYCWRSTSESWLVTSNIFTIKFVEEVTWYVTVLLINNCKLVFITLHFSWNFAPWG